MLRRSFGSMLLGAHHALPAAPGDPMLDFIRKEVIPLRGVSPELPLRTLRPLKSILAGAQVVGVGECNHGASEFQVFKHRLFRFLVDQMGFTTFALEGSFSAWKELNNYVLTGLGTRDEALTAQGYSVWDSREMAAQVDWMRQYNQTARPEKKVRFVGLDLAYTAASRANVLRWLKSRAPDRAAAAAAMLQPMEELDEKWPRRFDAAQFKAMLPEVQTLAQFVRQNALGAGAAADPLTDPVWDMNVIEQCVQFAAGGLSRGKAMGANLVSLLEHYPGVKVLVSAFNTHVARDEPGLGQVAAQHLGNAYYALASEFGAGSFLKRVVDPDRSWSGFHVVQSPELPERSLPWYLMQARKGSVFLPFRKALPAASAWLNQPQQMHQTSWALNPGPAAPAFVARRLSSAYDGVFFVERIQPAQPTTNALEIARKRLRF